MALTGRTWRHLAAGLALLVFGAVLIRLDVMSPNQFSDELNASNPWPRIFTTIGMAACIGWIVGGGLILSTTVVRIIAGQQRY
ncbi:hypothetical protein ACODT4_44225 [Streptomyces sp. 2.9]|uniref:hypothetical protein n=1 Tax=Streptomyces tritrimontium TaxID=3406573 RepID=UPI003BB60752